MLARAEAIQAGKSLRLDDSAEVEALVSAASEAGLSRDAVLQALRERLQASAPPEPGETAFAKSADGHSYMAEVVEVREHSVKVAFLGGGSAEVRPNELVRFSPSPGLQVQARYPSWGWWNSTVLGYDERTKVLTVSDNMGSEYKFPVSEIRLPRPKTRSEVSLHRLLMGAALFLGGAGVGALMLRLLTR
ncbi:MAG: hypothetical protein AB7F50_09590 [Fimbriimonadaceae bacterium]